MTNLPLSAADVDPRTETALAARELVNLERQRRTVERLASRPAPKKRKGRGRRRARVTVQQVMLRLVALAFLLAAVGMIVWTVVR